MSSDRLQAVPFAQCMNNNIIVSQVWLFSGTRLLFCVFWANSSTENQKITILSASHIKLPFISSGDQCKFSSLLRTKVQKAFNTVNPSVCHTHHNHVIQAFKTHTDVHPCRWHYIHVGVKLMSPGLNVDDVWQTRPNTGMFTNTKCHQHDEEIGFVKDIKESKTPDPV